MTMELNGDVLVIDGVTIDVTAYSKSPTFLGWHSLREGASYDRLAATIQMSLRHIGRTAYIVTSMVHVREPGAVAPDDVDVRMRGLLHAGWMRMLTVSEWDTLAARRKLEPTSEDFLSAMNRDFRQVETLVDGQDFRRCLRDMIHLLSHEFVLTGHIFICAQPPGVVVYPHAERGIGVFAPAGAAARGREVLAAAKHSE